MGWENPEYPSLNPYSGEASPQNLGGVRYVRAAYSVPAAAIGSRRLSLLEQAPVTRPGQERLAVVAASVSLIHPITRCFTPTLGCGRREDPFQNVMLILNGSARACSRLWLALLR